MKFRKSKHILPALLLSLVAIGAAADRIISVYRGGNVVYSTSASNVDSISYGSSGLLFRLYSPAGKQLYSGIRTRVDSIVFRDDHTSYPTINTTSGYNHMTAEYSDYTQTYTLTTTGGDPYIYTDRLTANLPADSCVLAFEYNCPAGISGFQIFFADPTAETRSANVGSIPATVGTEWAQYRLPIANYRNDFGWGNRGDRLRLDFGNASGVTIKLRGIQIYSMNEQEKKDAIIADSIEKAKKSMAERLKTYLAASYDSKITNVEVLRNTVRISGSCSGEGSFAVADIAPFEDVTEEKEFSSIISIPDSAKGNFTITVGRRARRGTVSAYDRALSKWAIVRLDGDAQTLVSHAHYADSVVAVSSPKKLEFKTKKGIAAGGGATYIADFDSLQAHSITQNIVLNAIISQTPGGAFNATHSYGGRTYYINAGAISGLDNTLTAAYKKDVVVEAIILTTTGSAFQDPECTGGYYTMPNMTTAEAVNFYAAGLDYLAKRYSSATHGRIHHWIMHNEVDQGTTWTNMGLQPELRYNDRYMKSMRLCYNIVRQYDQNASILGSYTHTWYDPSNEYSPRTMLEQNVAYSKAEGDFRWGVAYHPYPMNLTLPAFWNNDRNQATFSNNSPYVTFYNPEVINAWILKADNRYKDGTKRVLVFSEQGTNSPSYSANDLALQAAGAAWIWKKIEQLPGIDAMQWHNWADNRAEFGLRIGLRAFEDGDFKALQPKPVWYVWQAAGTDREDEVFAPYLKTIGISSWDGIIRTVR